MKSPIEIRVSRRARKDRSEILQYTFATWGQDQLEVYDAALESAFQRIQAFPDIGHPIEGRPSNLRSYHLEHHASEYPREADWITILRIINPRRRGQR
jgi:plasmid stabilization system protein ParE